MKKKTPIFKKILIPLMALTVIEILILVVILFGQGLLRELNQNEKDVLIGKVSARKHYLESMMVNDWMDVEDTVTAVTQATERFLQENHLTAQHLDDDAKTVGPLLTQVTPLLIEMMRSNRVTGVYLILNTEDLSGVEKYPVKPGVYLSDPDPDSLSSEDNEDLFLKISPSEVLTGLSIPTDAAWDPYFRFQGENEKFWDILYQPFQVALQSGGKYTWQNMGRWCIPESSAQYKEPILTYTVPLLLSDGTAVGVMGIDISFQYLSTVLPSSELGFENQGSYLLAIYDQNSGKYSNAYLNGNTAGLDVGNPEGFAMDTGRYHYREALRLYDTNTPFSSDTWVIGGVVQEKYMQAFSNNLIAATALAVAIALLVGVCSCLFLSYRLQKPIAQLASEIQAADPQRNLTLTPTGIREVDAMGTAIMNLSYDVLESGRKFSTIIEMASLHMSGFQLNHETGLLFLTDDFFSVFGDHFDQSGMTAEYFSQLMNRYREYTVEADGDNGVYMIKLPVAGKFRYIRLRTRIMEHSHYGLAEDVTQEILEKQVLQHERDHDPLTGLYNRKAFRAQLNEVLCLPPEVLQFSGLVMIDLDNLKFFNDTFGHECGDQYIAQAARSILEGVPENSLCARISGDEFNVFLYGFPSRQALSEQITQLQISINSGAITLPDGTPQLVHATGGIAYYPEHSSSVDDLVKYADYAMYIAKRNHKRSFQEFNPEMFRSQDIQLRNSDALTKMLQYNLVHFAMQPIVDARTGKVFAYESLMRPDVDSFFTVFEVLETARYDGKLEQVEELTLFGTLKIFDSYVRQGIIPPTTHLFLNSIANHCISQKKGEAFVAMYGKYAPQLVLELTEEERIDREIWKLKEKFHRELGGKVALDDYGSGYNSERTLLDISPDYIKVDMSIIRNIHLDPDKQTIVENILNFAHARGKFIIAEGIETEGEARQLMAMDVDYMQGYFFGKPQRTPQDISPESKKLFR